LLNRHHIDDLAAGSLVAGYVRDMPALERAQFQSKFGDHIQAFAFAHDPSTIGQEFDLGGGFKMCSVRTTNNGTDTFQFHYGGAGDVSQIVTLPSAPISDAYISAQQWSVLNKHYSDHPANSDPMLREMVPELIPFK